MNSNITISGITFTPDDIDQIAEAVTAVLQTTAKDPSQYEVANTLEGVTTLPVFKQSGNTFTLVRVLTSLLKGADGRQIELRTTATHLQWRLLDAPDWINLLPISTLMQEVAELYGGDIAQLRDLKFDGVEKTEEGLLFYANGEIIAGPIEVGTGSGGGTGGGSGGGGSVIRVQNLGSSSVGIAAGQTVIIQYNFTSVDAETEEPTGDGTAAYYVNSIRIATRNIRQGANTFDLTPYLAEGVNTVRVQVTDSYGAVRQLNIGITVANISLTSTFNADVPYSSAVSFPFTPVGSGTKTVHFILDGEELAPLTTTAANRQLTYTLPPMTHGAHPLRVYATLEVGGVTLTSGVLNFDIIYLEAGNSSIIIASAFERTEATQYDTLAIRYTVYNPASQTTAVALSANGSEVATLLVDRTPHTWSYRIPHAGSLLLAIEAGDAVRQFTLDVQPSPIDSEAETEALELHLTSGGRSNNELNPGVWKYNGIEAALNGFNYVTNGWVLDDRNAAVLRINAGASVTIPFKPFQADFRGTGKTIEFEFATRDVENYSAVLVSCMSGNRGFRITAQQVLFRSELSRTETMYKDNEHVRISFVVETMLQNRLIYTYINGVRSGVVQYPVSDNFAQNSPVNITVGSPECTIDIYNIRAYASPLNDYQVLNNFIADTADVAQKLALYDRNQVYDSTGDIVYSLLLPQIPCMTVVGDLPTFKGDKKTVQIIFENLQSPDRSFTSENVQIDVQGTSSQYYPRKNFKTKHNGGFYMTESGETVSKYKIHDDDIAGKVLCEKTDYAESSGTHNTGLARFINDLLKAMGIKTPPQVADENVRTTVDGYPVVMFHRSGPAAPIEFVGKYNMNYDKDSQEVFGFTDGAATECWEFLNNTSDLCLFKSDDFSGDWGSDLEARFPDGYANPANIQALWSWIVECTGNPAKFKSELEQHFNKANVISYYLLTEMFGMVDQRAKNMFATSWGNEGGGEYKWYFIFYDNDTCNGINNEGLIAFGYDIETEDTLGSGHVWNGWDSELWKLVKAAFAAEIAEMYASMRASLLTYEAVSHMLNVEQCAKWCEVVYNLDGQYKYIQPLIESGNGSYLYALQGSRLEHRKWWLSNRFEYMDSRYNAAGFLSDYVTMRLYTPSTWQAVEPDASFTLTPYRDSYLRVKYGSYVMATRAQAGVPVTVEAPDIQFNDTETIIYGASAVKGLGDLAAKYAGTVDISHATKLTELILGSSTPGYDNANLHAITLGNNTMLKKLDVRNCSGLSAPVDVSGCQNMEEIYASGTNTTAVILAGAGNLKHLELPATVSNLTLKNQPLAADGLVIAGLLNISTLVLENLPGIDAWAFALDFLQTAGNSLERVRLTAVHAESATMAELSLFDSLAGLDENGITTEHVVIAGAIHFALISDKNLAKWAGYYPDLVITYDMLDAVIVFEDPVVKAICVNKWDTDGDGELSTLEAAAVTDAMIANSFNNNAQITKFNEFRFFKGVTTINGTFSNSSLEEITIPASVTSISSMRWITNANLKKVVIESSNVPVCIYNTWNSYAPYTVFPQTVEEIYINRPFYRDPAVGNSAFPFAQLANLTKIVFGELVDGLPERTLSLCTALTEVVIPANILTLGSYVFSGSNLGTVIFESAVPPALGSDVALNGLDNAAIYVPDSAVNTYKTAPGWEPVTDRINPVSEKL
jgi:hypothetical protein